MSDSMEVNGWSGDWSTFRIGSKHEICTHSKPDCKAVELSEMDVSRPVFYR